MAWTYIEQAIESGVVVDPRDIDACLAGLAGEMNGHLDRDNMSGEAVDEDKIQDQALVSIGDNQQYDGGASLQTIPDHQTGQWIVLSDLTESVTTSDGELIVDADANLKWEIPGTVGDSSSNYKFEMRLLVDGNPIAHTGWCHHRRPRTGQSLTGSIPVAAGTHTIEVQIRAWSDPWYLLTNINNGTQIANTKASNFGYTDRDIDLLAGNVVWVHRKR